MRSAVGKAVVKYFKTTTLHGLKYVVSRYHADRFCWSLWFVASACCAGVLCGVLWQRFLLKPGLLTLQHLPDNEDKVTGIAVCQRPDDIANNFLSHVASDGADNVNKSRLLAAFVTALQGKKTNATLVRIIDNLIANSGLTLLEIFLEFSPSCEEMVRKCRLENFILPCEELFTKQATEGGVCCSTELTSASFAKVPEFFRTDVNIKLELVLNCRVQPDFHGCMFFTKFGKFAHDEEISPVILGPGNIYSAEYLYTIETDNNEDKMVGITCISDEEYSQLLCLLKCVEKKCGCYNSLIVNYAFDNPENRLPPCQLYQYACIKKIIIKDRGRNYAACNCLPSCGNILKRMILESMEITSVQHVIDPLMSFVKDSQVPDNNSSNILVSQTVVLRLFMNGEDSITLTLLPTESWLTLLASMGGVFNCFLGVGLFSALEFLYFLFLKLPVAAQPTLNKVPKAREEY